jgi:hypothetical protein
MFTSICIGFIFVGLSNYRYYSGLNLNNSPLLISKKKTALRLIILSSAGVALNLLIIVLQLIT